MASVRRRKIAAAATGPAGFVASAAQVAGAARIRRAFRPQAWQKECWDFYDEVGEYRYAQTWLAMAGSRAELDVEQEINGEWQALATGPAVDYLNELLDGCGGLSQFLYTTLLHLGVPGESFVIGEDVLDAAGFVQSYKWTVIEASELDSSTTPPTITDPETDEKRPLGDGALIIRVWRPHPKKRGEADSPSHAVIPVLREIEHISKHIAATVDSRLAGNGLLILPKDVSITTSDGVTADGQATADGKDPFMTALTSAMVAPISDRDSPAAVVPVVVRMPGEFISLVQHLKFGTEFDAQAMPLREAAIKRLALGLDIPPEQLLGMATANHWGAWQIEEGTVKTVIEPALQLVVDALTHQFLVPMMQATGGGLVRYRVAYRVDKLILRPNRAQDAKDLYALAVIGSDALREAAGFDPNDAPDDDELRRMMMIEMVKAGRVDPTTGDALGLPRNTAPVPGSAGDTVEPLTPAPAATPALPAAPAGPVNASLLPAAEALVLRALERAGNKRRSRSDNARLASVADHNTHLHLQVLPQDTTRLLDNAWTLLPDVAALNGVDEGVLRTVLDTFATALLVEAVPYDVNARSALGRYLQEVA